MVGIVKAEALEDGGEQALAAGLGVRDLLPGIPQLPTVPPGQQVVDDDGRRLDDDDSRNAARTPKRRLSAEMPPKRRNAA